MTENNIVGYECGVCKKYFLKEELLNKECLPKHARMEFGAYDETSQVAIFECPGSGNDGLPVKETDVPTVRNQFILG